MRRVLLALLAIAVTLGVLLLGLAVLVFLVELRFPVEGYRDRIAAAASRTLGIEARIEGPLHILTGPRAGIELQGLRLSGTTGAARWVAQVGHARLRLRLAALLAREVRIVEVGATEVTWCTVPGAAATIPAQAPAARTQRAWRLTGIDLVKVERLAIIAGEACVPESTVAEITSLEGRLPVQESGRLAASGTLQGQAWQARLGGPGLASLTEASVRSPFDLAVDIAGARLRAVGAITPVPLDAEADVTFDSAQLVTLLASLGAPLKDFGPVAARAHVHVGATRLAARIDEARLVPFAATGDLSVDWSGQQPHLSLRARTDTLDAVALRQWLTRSIDRDRIQPGKLQRFLIARMRDTEGDLAVDAARVLSGGISLNAFAIAGGWRNGLASGSVAARMGEAAAKGTFRADVRGEELALAAAAGAESVTLPGDIGITGTIGSLNADINAHGPLGP